MDKDTLAVEWVPTDRLFENPANPRLNDAAVPHVAASVQRFGWRQPIVARPSGEVIAGNTRLKAARELGLGEVPVVRFDGPDVEAVAFAIADNRTHEFAEWTNPHSPSSWKSCAPRTPSKGWATRPPTSTSCWPS